MLSIPIFNCCTCCFHAEFCYQSCNIVINECEMNATCKTAQGYEWESCRNIFEWSELSDDTEPVCTNKCKESLIKLESILGKNIRCCSCGEITDDRKLNDVSAAIQCHQIRRNIDRWCPNTVPTSCPECGRHGNNTMYVLAKCLLFSLSM